jgi:hypothetical protein
MNRLASYDIWAEMAVKSGLPLMTVLAESIYFCFILFSQEI